MGAMYPHQRWQTVSLYAEVGGRRSAIEAHPLAFEDMPPALWMSNRRKGRAHLSTLVQDAYPGLSLRHVRLGDVPNHFGALRFARLIIISGEDFASLEASQQSAIHNAEAAGVTVVLTAPFGTVSETAFWMEGFSVGEQRPPETYPGTLGEGHIGWHYIDGFPKGEVFIAGPEGALAIEVRNGLGRRRLVGVDVAKLPTGEVTRRILSPTMDSVAPVLRWLSGHQPLGPADPPGVETHLIVLVCLLAIGLFVFRRSLVRTSVFVLCWSTISVFIQPSLEPVTLESARTVLVPFHGGGVAVTSLDVSVVQGGSICFRVELSDEHEMLEEMRCVFWALRINTCGPWTPIRGRGYG